MIKKVLFWTIAIVFGIIIISSGVNNTLDPKENREERSEREPRTENYEFYYVTKVIDGDTLIANVKGTKTTIRLIGVNTPEVDASLREVECFGEKPSREAKKMLFGKQIRIEKDSSQGDFDKYGRTLAYVFLKDGTFFNEYMIKEGYAYEYTYNLPYKYQDQFKKSQDVAERKEKGLWEIGVCQNF